MCFAVIVIVVGLEWRVSSLKNTLPAVCAPGNPACCFAFINAHYVPAGDAAADSGDDGGDEGDDEDDDEGDDQG